MKKMILFLGITAFLIMGIFPPWIFILDDKTGGPTGLGYYESPGHYSFVLTPPTPPYHLYHCKIDYSRLFIQWFILSIMIGLLLRIVKDRKIP